MTLARWQIVFARENDADTVGYPALIPSGPDILADERQLRFNALMGTKRLLAGSPLPHQVQLDQADACPKQYADSRFSERD